MARRFTLRLGLSAWLISSLSAVAGAQVPAPQSDTAGFSGQVLEAGAALPVAGARVVLGASPPFDTSPPPQTTSDSAGRFAFGSLPGGRYAVYVHKVGFVDGGPSSTFELAPGEQRGDVIVSIERGGVITGRVVDPSGNPVTDARVFVLQRARADAQPRPPIYWPLPRFQSAGSSQTNDIGEFRIVGLRSGAYFLGAVPPPDPSYRTGIPPPSMRLVDTLYPNARDGSLAAPIAVTAGLTVSDVLIRLLSASSYHLSGIVVDEHALPVQDAVVTLEPSSGKSSGVGGTTRTDARGQFSIDVVSGDYTAIVSAPIRPGVRPPDPTRKSVTVGETGVNSIKVVIRTEPR
jgi:hypothetical protein